MKILLFIKALIEELFTVVILIWNLPVAIIEMIWFACFDRKKFWHNWNILKSSITGKHYVE